MRSGQLVQDKVQVLTDKFPDMEKVATGKIAKADQEKEQLRIIAWCPLLGNLGKGLPKKISEFDFWQAVSKETDRPRSSGPCTGPWDT